MCTLEQQFVNIGGVADFNYRYKMPALQVQQSKKKTLLPNILQVAKALHCSSHSGSIQPRPQEIVEFFKLELGTGGSCPSLKKLAKGDPATGAHLAGKHDKATLTAILAEYVETFVLCGVCQKPETSYRFHKTKKTIKMDCVGCGACLKIESDHKLCKYIRKQHEADASGEDRKENKKQKKKKEKTTTEEDKKEKTTTEVEAVEPADEEKVAPEPPTTDPTQGDGDQAIGKSGRAEDGDSQSEDEPLTGLSEGSGSETTRSEEEGQEGIGEEEVTPFAPALSSSERTHAGNNSNTPEQNP